MIINLSPLDIALIIVCIVLVVLILYLIVTVSKLSKTITKLDEILRDVQTITSANTKNIKLNDSAAPIVMAEIFMHFCFNEFMFTNIL